MAFCLVLGAPEAATASTPPTCLGFSAVAPPENCDDNEALGYQALSCVRDYYRHVQASQKEILERFQAEAERMKREQSDSYDRTRTGYDETRKKLQALMEQGRQARAAVDSLADNLHFPEDYDQPKVTGMSTAEYLATEECFAVPTRVMKQSKAMLDKIQQDLLAVERTALGKQSSSQQRSVRVEVVAPKEAAARTVGKGAGKFEKRQHRQPASDITGTERPRDLMPDSPKQK